VPVSELFQPINPGFTQKETEPARKDENLHSQFFQDYIPRKENIQI
jgi:hypothetical protein